MHWTIGSEPRYAMPYMANSPSDHHKNIPLCVDLDGTLVKTDTLLESVLLLLKKNPLSFALIPYWLLRGKAHLKWQIANRAMPDPALLPYNKAFLLFLKKEKARGRKLVLATGSDERIAKHVAKYLGIFDDVIGSTSKENCSGQKKAEILNKTYGHGKYEYAGNSRKDVFVWRKAAGAYVVRANARVLKQASRVSKVIQTFPAEISVGSIIKTIRIHQWSKNLLVFVPALFGHKFATDPFLPESILAFIAFSLFASSVYIINDLLDLESDRLHEHKKQRPFASGSFSISSGFALLMILLVSGIAVTTLLPVGFLLVVLLYLAVTTAYSLKMKQIPILDVLVLACLYVLRIYAGSAATGIEVSKWLLGLSILLFFSIAVAKRCAELQKQAVSKHNVKGRGYNSSDLPHLMQAGIIASIATLPLLMLYVNSDKASMYYEHPVILWITLPFALYWISRFWLLVSRDAMLEDPVEFALKDKQTYITAGLILFILFAAS